MEKSTTRMHLKKTVSSMIFSCNYRVRYRQFSLSNMRFLCIIYMYIYIYKIYIIYMIYEIYDIHLYIYIWYKIDGIGIRDIWYTYMVNIYGNQNWTILYQFWNMFRHLNFLLLTYEHIYNVTYNMYMQLTIGSVIRVCYRVVWFFTIIRDT